MRMTRREREYWEERADLAVAELRRHGVNAEDEMCIADVEAVMSGEMSLMDRWRDDPRYRAEFAEQVLEDRRFGIPFETWDADFRFPWGLIPPEEEVAGHWVERPFDD